MSLLTAACKRACAKETQLGSILHIALETHRPRYKTCVELYMYVYVYVCVNCLHKQTGQKLGKKRKYSDFFPLPPKESFWEE